MLLSRIAAGTLLCGSLALPLAAQASFKHILPKDTLVFMTAPDLETTIKEFQATPLFKMWKEQEVQDFLADALKMVKKQYEEALEQGRAMHKQGAFPFDPDMLMKLRVKSVGFALTSFDVQMVQGMGGPQPKIGLLLHMEFGPTADMWRKVIEFGVAQIEAESGMERTESEVAGVKMYTIGREGMAMGLRWAFVGSSVLIGTLKNEVEAGVTHLVKNTSDLTDSALYKAAAKHIDQQGAELEFFVQPARIVDVVMGLVRKADEMGRVPPDLDIDGLDRAVTAFGLRSMKAFSGTSSYQGNRSVTKIFVLSPQPERKGFFAAEPRPIDMGFLAWIPKDAANFMAAGLNMQALYDALIAAAKAYDKEQAEQALGQLSEMEGKLGMKVRDDLLGAFGKKMVWWSMGMSSFMDVPEWGMLFDIKDKDKLLKSLEIMTKMTNGMLELSSSERRNVKTWRLEVSPDQVEPQVEAILNMVQPCFTFKKGHMVAALSPADVRRAAKRMTPKEGSTDNVLHNESFAAFKDSIPKQGVTSLAWTDWKATFENYYQAITSVLALIPQNEEIPFDLTLLPESETLSQHMFGQVAWSTANAEGFTYTDISPVGPEIFMGLAAVGASAALIGQTRMNRQPMRAAAAAPAEMEEVEEEVEEEEVEVKKTEKKKGKKK